MKISQVTINNWNLNKENILESKYKWSKTKDIISFIYCPKTREFALGNGCSHKTLIQVFKTSYKEFIRGIYIRNKKKVILRAYDIDSVKNFNAQYDTVEALNLHTYKIKFNASSDELYSQYEWA